MIQPRYLGFDVTFPADAVHFTLIGFAFPSGPERVDLSITLTDSRSAGIQLVDSSDLSVRLTG